MGLISQVRRVTTTLVWDRESAIGGTGRVSAPVAAFAGTLATRIRLAPRRDPEFKGITERNNRFLETSFLPGRSFSSPADFNTQLGRWPPSANTRTVRSIGGRPVDLLDTTTPPWFRCRRWIRRSGWRTGSGWPATTTCASTPATTPSIHG